MIKSGLELPAKVDAPADECIPSDVTIRCEATMDLEHAAKVDWDATVIGAGPAGALAARQLAMSGLRTLLVDKSPFPRPKVCGGCISGLGLDVLRSVDLGRLVEEPAATILHRLELSAMGKRATLPLPMGAAVSRFDFDARLVHAAIAAGADFLPETAADIRGLSGACRFRCTELQQSSRGRLRARSRIVLAADGLGRTSTKQHRLFSHQISAGSRVGLGATVPSGHVDLPSGVISMSVGRRGYVGMVRVPGNRIDVAAAVDPTALREHGPAETVRDILHQAGFDAPRSLLEADWRGTGLLTRKSSRVAAKRLVLVGDAAGYVEPFTGEGMTWAMLSAVSAAKMVDHWLVRCDDRRPSSASARYQEIAELANAWSRQHRTQLARRQRDCRIIASFLRHPFAVRAAMGILALVPDVAKPFIHYFWNPSKELP